MLSVILVGSGAFFGALIAVIAQVVAGIQQRQQEKAISTFNVRLKLYVDFCTQYRELAYRAEDRKNIYADMDELEKQTSNLEDGVSKAVPDVAGTPDKESAKIEFDPVKVNLKKIKSETRKLRGKMDSYWSGFRELEMRLIGTRTAIELVSSSAVREEILALTEVIKRENFTYKLDHLNAFLKAARLDLKIVD